MKLVKNCKVLATRNEWAYVGIVHGLFIGLEVHDLFRLKIAYFKAFSLDLEYPQI